MVEALDSVRPYMESHGGNVELLGVEDAIARIRLEGSCDGCPASSSTLELAIKSALDEAAPDLEGLVVEGAVAAPQAAPPGPGSVELPVVQVAAAAERPADAGSTWTACEDVGEGELRAATVNGLELVVAASRATCSPSATAAPAAGGARTAAELSDDGTLACPSCARRFFLPRAGRSLDDDGLLLEPVPLLDGASGARVALHA